MTAVDREVLAGPTRGVVDLVAVERALDGKPVRLTNEEVDYLFAHMTGSNEECRNISAALGWAANSVERAYHRRKRAAPL